MTVIIRSRVSIVGVKKKKKKIERSSVPCMSFFLDHACCNILKSDRLTCPLDEEVLIYSNSNTVVQVVAVGQGDVIDWSKGLSEQAAPQRHSRDDGDCWSCAGGLSAVRTASGRNCAT